MDNTKYYEKFDWQSAELSKKLFDKIQKLISVIPSDVQTILDVGCGDGTISIGLNEKFNVFASDRSINALKQFNISRVCSSADSVSIKPNSVDLVFSSEMIEHLPDEIFYNSISEFKRISKKYIFLTFPNNENIDKLKTQCTECKYTFNKSYHLRTLNSEIIQNLFPEYSIITQFKIGKKVRHYNKVLSYIKHNFSPATAWIPKYWMKENESIRKTMCPQCGHSFQIPYKFHPISTACDMLNILISKKEPYQLCILLEKK